MIIKPRNRSDIYKCVDLYIPDETIFIPSVKHAKRNLEIAWLNNAFIRLYLEDDEILGWILAEPIIYRHLSYPILNQSYCCIVPKGLKAVRILKELHVKLMEEAELKEMPLVFSSGGYHDKYNTFVKILEKFGWERHNSTAVHRTSWYAKLTNK